jgi:hypothetical protein
MTGRQRGRGFAAGCQDKEQPYQGDDSIHRNKCLVMQISVLKGLPEEVESIMRKICNFAGSYYHVVSNQQ